jgi:hypothetical protein
MKGSKKHIIWHYTNGATIEAILASGIIDVSSAGIGKGERPAAWFSTNPHWDASANKGNIFWENDELDKLKDTAGAPPGGMKQVQLPTDKMKVVEWKPEMMEGPPFNGRYRVGVSADAAEHTWGSFKKWSGIDPEVARHIETTVGMGNPTEWRASYQPVGRKFWRRVERLIDGVWVTHVEVTHDDGRTLSKAETS